MGFGATASPTGYISSRRRSGGVVSFKCYDRMIYTEQSAVVPEEVFSKTGENTGTIESRQLVQMISKQCGFKDWGIGGEFVGEIPDIYIPRDYVHGKSCKVILEAVSAAWCGYFKTSLSDQLIFIPFAAKYGRGTAHYHTEIIEGGCKGPIEQLIMTNGTDTFFMGNQNADVFGTLKISSDFASADAAAKIFERVKGYIYQAWSCEKCLIDDGIGDTEIDAEITFADGKARIANSIEKIPTSRGFLCRCGRNEVTEDEFDYTGALSREIEKRIADGEVLGGKMMITRYQGIEILSEDSAPAAAKSTGSKANVTKYGVNVGKNGVTVYEGDFISEKIFESAERIDENTVVINYADFKIKYTKTSDGNKMVLKKEFIREADANG